MIDMAQTIIPKSSQLNADDLIGRTMTVKVTNVARSTTPEQPILINFEGDNGKPFMPGKSMRRVLAQLWGMDGAAYVGRRMTLYRDDTVIFGGVPVGGIRISHMSHIKGTMTMALTASKSQRKPFVVQPLGDEAPILDIELLTEDADAAASKSLEDYQVFWKGIGKAARDALLPVHEEMKAKAIAADAARAAADVDNAEIEEV